MHAPSRDAFLGGRLAILQPSRGYRAGTDPVLLAAAVPARAGQSVLELGCGAGVASLCLGARVAGLSLTGVELQPDYANLAERNAAQNAQTLEVIRADIAALPAELRQRNFDHVIANPPFYRADHGAPAADPGKALAFAESLPLARWVEIGLKRLAPKGRITMIQRVERLPELLAALQGAAGEIRVLPLAGRAERPPERVLVSARKGARGAFRLDPALVLHDGTSHSGDRDSFVPAVSEVLRNAAALPWLTR